MSRKEIDRLEVIQRVVKKGLLQREGADQLGLSVRQVRRLVIHCREAGVGSLVSGHRGKRPGNAIAESVREEALQLLSERYSDFGPTLAVEKLDECHGHKLSVETVRGWMIAAGLWQAKRRRQAQIHPRRRGRKIRSVPNGFLSTTSLARWYTSERCSR